MFEECTSIQTYFFRSQTFQSMERNYSDEFVAMEICIWVSQERIFEVFWSVLYEKLSPQSEQFSPGIDYCWIQFYTVKENFKESVTNRLDATLYIESISCFIGLFGWAILFIEMLGHKINIM